MHNVTIAISGILKRSEFFFFKHIQDLLKKVFLSYSKNVFCIGVQNKVLKIGVDVPHLVFYFSSLKQVILKKMKAYGLKDIDSLLFFFRKSMKKTGECNMKRKEEKYNFFEKKSGNSIDLNSVEVFLRKKNLNSEYYGLLLKIYTNLIAK